jgi:uncharacterized protein
MSREKMMSPEERQLLTGLFDRIRAAAATPRDPEAEALIAEAVRNQPYAPYLLAQAVIVQDQALQAANAKIEDLENQLREDEPPQQPPGTGGFLGSIFGASAPRPAPQAPSGPWGQQQTYAPPPPPPGGPWGGGAPMGGGGFLQGALGTAAGVAGGVLLANSIGSLFGAHNNPFGIGTGFGGLGGGETVVNNYYEGHDSTPTNADYQDASFDESSADFGSGDDGSLDV